MIEIVPMTLKQANRFVEREHRHHGEVRGQKFSIGCAVGDEIVGVVIVGRPVSRVLDNGWTLEVLRCCTDGTKNACSALYAAAWRASRAMGYKKLVTYTLASESGVSLKAAGWRVVAEVRGGSWSRRDRPRVVKNPAQLEFKFRWEKEEDA